MATTAQIIPFPCRGNFESLLDEWCSFLGSADRCEIHRKRFRKQAEEEGVASACRDLRWLVARMRGEVRAW